MNSSAEGRKRHGNRACQVSLFAPASALESSSRQEEGIELTAQQLRQWQEQLARVQAPLFAGADGGSRQGELFDAAGAGAEPWEALAASINPLALRAQALSFWRWPQAPQQGAALYFVMDGFLMDGFAMDSSLMEGREPGPGPLLLYVGETGRADLRWKGEHDCKHYLAAYTEAMRKAGLDCRLSIRFWLDAPASIKGRRALEQALIQRWLPPFNKENRHRWVTPFTAPPA